MLEVKNVQVYDLKESVIASGNAMRTELPEYSEEEFTKGLERMKKLARTPMGSGHQTALSGIRVSFDLVYPNYISPELQRYHFFDIVTSSSKMHRLLKMDLDKACNEYVSEATIKELKRYIAKYNFIEKHWRDNYKYEYQSFEFRDGTLKKVYDKQRALYYAWMQIISNCPQGIQLFMRCSTNYLSLKNIYFQRRNHKLKEDWGAFCRFIEELPYANELIICED